MKSVNLTKKEVREGGLKEYFVVVLYDEDLIEVDEVIGRFATLKEAQFEARRFCLEELDDSSNFVDILRFYYKDNIKSYEIDYDFCSNF